jgi:hypothetical protein
MTGSKILTSFFVTPTTKLANCFTWRFGSSRATRHTAVARSTTPRYCHTVDQSTPSVLQSGRHRQGLLQSGRHRQALLQSGRQAPASVAAGTDAAWQRPPLAAPPGASRTIRQVHEPGQGLQVGGNVLHVWQRPADGSQAQPQHRRRRTGLAAAAYERRSLVTAARGACTAWGPEHDGLPRRRRRTHARAPARPAAPAAAHLRATAASMVRPMARWGACALLVSTTSSGSV